MLKAEIEFKKVTISSSTVLDSSHESKVVICDTDTAGADFNVSLPTTWTVGKSVHLKNTGTGGFDAVVYVEGKTATFQDAKTSFNVADGEYARVTRLSGETDDYLYTKSTTLDFGVAEKVSGFDKVQLTLDMSKVHINTESATETKISSNFPKTAVRSVTGDTTLTQDDTVVVASGLSGATTITLPAISTLTGSYEVVIINEDAANGVTVARAGSDTIGDGSTTSLALAAQYSKTRLVAGSGTVWYAV